MKLYYWKPRNPDTSEYYSNFGDSLNGWLWPRLLPDFFDDDASTVFLGIGSMLNSVQIPPQRKVVVFGAGVGYGSTLSFPIDNLQIYCVRGPLSALALKQPMELAITDPALLVGRLVTPAQGKRYGTAFMPHWQNAFQGEKTWKRICKNLGFHYLDPTLPVDQLLLEIDQCRHVLAEAMHGAIVADALRVPWTPVHTYHHVHPFKWIDWTMSVDVAYYPNYTLSLTPDGRQSNGLAGSLTALARERIIQDELAYIAAHSPKMLSETQVLDRRLDQLEEKLAHLKRDFSRQ